jgi:ubiquinone biosynthesis protein UbiJ
MLTSTLENVLNRGLPRSPRAQQLCAELAGRRVGIATGPVQSGGSYLLVESTGNSLKLSLVTAGTLASAPPDAIVTGGLLSLLALSGPAPEAVLQRGDVRIDGDAELAQKFRELALLLRPDLEEELSLVLGDVPAHQL